MLSGRVPRLLRGIDACHAKTHRGKFLCKNASAAPYIQRRCAAIVQLQHLIEEFSEVPNATGLTDDFEQVETLAFIPPSVALLVVQSIVNLLIDLIRSGLHLVWLRFGRDFYSVS